MCDLISETMYEQLMDDIQDVISLLEEIQIASDEIDDSDIEEEIGTAIGKLERIVNTTLDEKAQINDRSDY